jgi:hypothetical protein
MFPGYSIQKCPDVDLNFCVIKFMYDIFVVCGNLYRSKSQESSSAAILPYIPLVTQVACLHQNPELLQKNCSKIAESRELFYSGKKRNT